MSGNMNRQIMDTRKRAALAEKGRFGDTEIRKVDNQPAHVSAWEASLIDSYGKKGEDMVKSVGSGTTNPDTGNKEYFVLSAINTGIGVANWLGGANKEAKANQAKMKALQTGIENLKSSSKSLQDNALRGISNLWEGLGRGLDTMQYQTGQNFNKLSTEIGGIIKKGRGLLTGTPEYLKTKLEKDTTEKMNISKEGMYADTSTAVTETSEKYQQEHSDINMQIQDMQDQITALSDYDTFWENIF